MDSTTLTSEGLATRWHQVRDTALRLVWPGTAVVALALLVISRMTFDQQLATVAAQRDTLSARVRRQVAAATQKLTVGDTLPAVRLADARGRIVALRDLARRGTTYFYLYRDDCPACQVLEPYWTARDAIRSGRLVRVAFDPARDLPMEGGLGDFAWRHDSLTRSRSIVEGVPALLAATPTGIIMASAYGLPQVAKMGGALELIDRRGVDSVVNAYQRAQYERAMRAQPRD
jgi:hypothetical protein